MLEGTQVLNASIGISYKVKDGTFPITILILRTA